MAGRVEIDNREALEHTARASTSDIVGTVISDVSKALLAGTAGAAVGAGGAAALNAVREDIADVLPTAIIAGAATAVGFATTTNTWRRVGNWVQSVASRTTGNNGQAR